MNTLLLSINWNPNPELFNDALPICSAFLSVTTGYCGQ